MLWVIAAFRLEIRAPADMRKLCHVVYCQDVPGTTPDESSCRSGLTVQDVEAGKSNWTQVEVEEFVSWMDNSSAISDWLETEFKAIDEQIKAHPLWKSDFMLKD